MTEEIKKSQQEQVYPEPTVGPIIYNEKGEILLIRSYKWGEMWHIPGGHVELGETCEAALKRETKEETNLKIDLIEFIGWQDVINPEFYHKKRHFIFMNFCARAVGGEIKKSDEMDEWKWIKPEEALKTMKIDPHAIKTIQFYFQHKEKSAEKSNEYLDKYKRALADYDNLKKETAKEKEAMGKFAMGMAAMSFLEVFENYKKAMRHQPDLKDITKEIKEIMEIEGKLSPKLKEVGQWLEGVGHIKNQFADVLKQMGIEEIKTVGEKFDPAIHEAVGEEEVEGKEAGIVIREIEGGYKMGEKVLKAAKVIAAK